MKLAIYRNVQLSFWTDNKVEDEFTPEDKYFYLYLLTNPQTNICGCYEISWSQIVNQTGYNKETILRLLERFENIHKVIKFDKATKEILLLNWHKYNWSKSEDTLRGVERVGNHIKSDKFKTYVFDVVNCIRNDTPYRPPIDPLQASVSDTVSVINTKAIDSIKAIDNTLDNIKEIINYFNSKCNTNYKYSTKVNQEGIRARLKEGFTIGDFKTVIDAQYEKWHNDPKMKEYLRPMTLFCTKFESYLNNAPKPKPETPVVEEAEIYEGDDW